MTTKQKIMSYLKRCKTFKTTKTIAERTDSNYNTVRRCLSELKRSDPRMVSAGVFTGESAWRLAA